MDDAEHREVVAVVFDCDGVLADTGACWRHGFEEAAAAVGLRLLTAHRESLRGAAVQSGGRAIATWAGTPDRVGELEEIIGEALMRSLRHVALKPLAGIAELLRRLTEHAVPLAVASNAPRPFLDRVLDGLGIRDRFAAVVSADQTRRPKPAPDPYEAACAALDADPARSIAIEDSEIGVDAARAAGLRVIGIGPDLSPGHPHLLAWGRTAADPRIAALPVL
jgi:HAD superfamily hydrolase (TIGR01509 family)